jgi:hypothetical protein
VGLIEAAVEAAAPSAEGRWPLHAALMNAEHAIARWQSGYTKAH